MGREAKGKTRHTHVSCTSPLTSCLHPTLGLAARGSSSRAATLAQSQEQETGVGEVIVGSREREHPSPGIPSRGLTSLPHTLPLSPWTSLSLPWATVSQFRSCHRDEVGGRELVVCSGRLKAGVWESCPSIFKPHTQGDQEGSGKRALAESLLSRSRPLPSQLRKYYLPPAREGSAQAYKTGSFQACKKPSSRSCVPHRPSKKEGSPGPSSGNWSLS